ncbi:unnamed protein product [Larinioides sclopetarius]|uniref:C2H2-type domain-containing protein n=1 Tax=Larinioides sclopetarius TaxID=280406 RepID=A0AAV1ZSR6_9ARAC
MAWNGNRYSCTRCDFSTNTTSSIRMHNQKCHSVVFSKKPPKVISRPKLPGRVNASLRLNVSSKVLSRPKTSSAAKKWFKCSQCSFKTDDRKLLSQHSLIHIEEQNSCSQCDARFYSKHELTVHMNNAHSKDDGPVRCDICFQEFPRVNSMTYHRRTHMQSQSFKCRFCQKIFCDVIAFRNHEGLHTESNSKKKQ